jgi:hypothetical protein
MTVNILKKEDGKRSKKRLAGLFLASFVTLAGAGAAFAYWTIGGTGSSTNATGSPASVTVVQTTTVTGMYPGDTVAVAGDFNNPNPGSVKITAVTAAIGTFSSQTDLSEPACTNLDFTISGTSNTPGEILPGSGVGTWSGLSINMVDSATNQNNCQNLTTVPITYTAS